MKKVFAMLLTTVAVLSASAATTQYLNLQYRIGAGGLVDNTDGRLHASLVVNGKPYVSDSHYTFLTNSIYATIPDGQRFNKWWYWYWYRTSNSNVAATTNDNWGVTATNCVWVYDSKINSAVWPSDKAVRIVADFDYINYNLSYNSNGGSGSMPGVSHIYTNKYNLAENAFAKTGYTFDGWTNSYVAAVLPDKAQITSGSTFGVTYTNASTTLYAKWTPNTYSVRFNSGVDDATGSMADLGFTYDVEQSLTANAFERDGWVFSGWTNATGTAYSDGATVKNLASEQDAVVDLYAKWTQMWTIVFKESTLFGSAVISSNKYENGASIVVPADPSHVGYTFRGWEPYVSVPATASRDQVYVAGYSANSYPVTFHSNYEPDVVNGTMSYTYGTVFNIPSSITGITSREGYVFNGWATAADAGEPVYQPAQQSILFVSDAPVDLYAVWTPIEYAIAFDANGGSGTMEPMTGVKYDESVTLSKNLFTKTGVDFKYWKRGNDTYTDEASVSNLTNVNNTVVTLTAVWSEKCYIAFDGHGGEGEMDTQTFDAETLPQSLTSNAFTKVGYTFGGWATNETEAAALSAEYVDGQTFTAFDDIPAEAGETATLYAVWQTNEYSIVFKPNCRKYTGEMEDLAMSYDTEAALTDNAFVNKDGLHFNGWSNTVSGVVYGNGATVSNLTAEAGAKVELYALWDNGDLSKAMNCDNLYWEPYSIRPWYVIEGDGYNGDNACAGVTNLGYMAVTVHTNGVLRFRWKATGNNGADVVKFKNWPDAPTSLEIISERKANADSGKAIEDAAWQDSGDIEVPATALENGSLTFGIRMRSGSGTCYIDQLTWTPADASVEPTEADRPVISGFEQTATETGSGFAIKISNASDDFSYQILATDDLTATDGWSVVETLTAAQIGAGWTIEIDQGEPKMFYKVKVTEKQ